MGSTWGQKCGHLHGMDGKAQNLHLVRNWKTPGISC
jgi:hypothetical protein